MRCCGCGAPHVPRRLRRGGGMMCVRCPLAGLSCRRFITAACVQSVSVPASERQDAAISQPWLPTFLEVTTHRDGSVYTSVE